MVINAPTFKANLSIGVIRCAHALCPAYHVGKLLKNNFVALLLTINTLPKWLRQSI